MIDEDKIIAYVMNELDESEHLQIATAIEKDENLQQISEHYRKILHGFRSKRVALLQEKIAAHENTLPTVLISSTEIENPTNQESNRPGSKGWIGISLIIISIVALLLLYMRSNYSDSNLAKIHFLMPADPAVAGGLEVSLYNSALDAFFNEKDYEKASRIFKTIQDGSPFIDQAKFFAAHADFLAGNKRAALSEFELLSNRINDFSPDQRGRIEWNHLISRLAAGETVLPLPANISNTEMGKALTKDLDSIWRKLFY